jgi:hypothetical protein
MKNINANANSFAKICSGVSSVKLIAKSLAIKTVRNYTLEKGESDIEAQHYTKKGHRASLQGT